MAESEATDFSKQLQYFVRILRVHSWTILTFLVVTVLVMMVGSYLRPRVYEASTTLLIDMEAPNILSISNSRDEATVAQTQFMAYSDYYRTQLVVIKSRIVVHQVINNLKLYDPASGKLESEMIDDMLAQLTVEPVKQTRLAKLKYQDTDPKRAARIANEWAASFVQANQMRSASTETLTLLKNEYMKLQAKADEFSNRYKPKFPTMIRLRQQMDQLANQIKQQAQVQVSYDRMQTEGGATPAQNLPTTFLEQLDQNAVTQGLRPNNVRIVDLATEPTKAIKPNKKLSLILGIFFGLLGGLGSAIALEFFDHTLRNAEDIHKEEGLILLGCIPSFNLSGSQKKIPKKGEISSIEIEPNSPAAEAYRGLRTNLIYAASQENARAFIVTSPSSGEGKTTTVTHLGIILAQIGLKVLLVDADLRRPRLHEEFSVKPGPGLSEYLIEKASLESIVQPTRVPGLSVVSSGAVPPNPAELLSTQKMHEFLKAATSKFDRVIFDTPPVIPVTDAVILAALTRWVLSVVQSGKTPRQALYRLREMCRDIDAKMLGVVLNNIPYAQTSTYGYYSYQRSPYGEPPKSAPSRPQDKFHNARKDVVAKVLKAIQR